MLYSDFHHALNLWLNTNLQKFMPVACTYMMKILSYRYSKC